MRTILEKVYKAYGASEKINEPHHHKHIRNTAINWACQAHLEACLDETSALMGKSLVDEEFEFSVDHKSVVMCNGVLKANQTVFEHFWNVYVTRNADDLPLILRTIGCMENEEILKQYIEKYDQAIGTQWLTIIQAVYANGPIGMKVTLNFLREKFDEFSEL